MALDGLVIHALIHELQSLAGARINKIFQPTEHDLLLHVRSQQGNHKLLLSANPTYPRIHLTNHAFINPLEAPMFCMLMRKHCESGIIESIKQIGMERIIHIQVRHRDELGDMNVKTIVMELMGRHSNIILLDQENGVIIDGIHHVTPAISSFRIVMPGSQYIAPPVQGKHNPLETTKELFLLLMEQAYDSQELQTYEQAIVRLFEGISPLAAREILYRSGHHENESFNSLQPAKEAIAATFVETMDQIKSHQYLSTIVEDDEAGKAYFSVLGLTHIPGQIQRFSSTNECLEAYYSDKAERDTVKQRISDLLRLIKNELNKNIKKVEKLLETIEEAKDADKFRILGELLISSIHLIKRGDKQIEVINYYDENQSALVITLDPLLTPSENAQRYYKKYSKSKNSLKVVEEQIRQTHQEIEYLNSLLQQMDTASLSDIAEIRDELVLQGYLRDRNKNKRKKKKDAKPVVSCFTSTEGIAIYVGKNNTQNDYVTNRLAQSSDTWLHTKDIPGSHVVIRSSNFGDATLEEAALLAAYYSQARESSQVPVDFTQIRHVHKPNGAKPGFVIYDHQQTLFVTPDEQRIKLLAVEMKS